MKIEGIVLQSIDYKETSKIVYLYTRMGKISVKSIGAKKPKNGSLGFITTGNIVSAVISDTKYPSLYEYDVIDSIYSITKDFIRVKVFMVMLEVIKNIPEDANHELIYDYVKKSLKDLLTEDPKKLLAIFLIKMLYPYGIQPSLKACANCNSQDIVFLDLPKGLCYCKNCTEKRNIEFYQVFKEYYYDKKNISEYTNYDLDEIFAYLNDYYLRYISLDLKIFKGI